MQLLQNTGDNAAFPGKAILGVLEIFVKAIHIHNTLQLLQHFSSLKKISPQRRKGRKEEMLNFEGSIPYFL